jgi:lipopolysaccharide/colanic/teichoic acid biosynthesis glycosyltransferase
VKKLQQKIKRLIDITGSVLALLFLSPLLFVIALTIFAEGQGNVFFTQMRVGQKGRPFRIYKFRSMRPHPIDYQNLQEVDAQNPNLTRLGTLLRRYGLDELPQLLNILKGEMSFIGPRPTIREQVEKYSPIQSRRLETLPGLTGLAQVSGNTLLAWDDRIALDIWYIDHFSLSLDFKIFVRTFSVLMRGSVMSQPNEQSATLPTLVEANGYVNQIEAVNGIA